MRSYGRSKRKCASISSRPLFASVAESIVIFGPMRPGRVCQRLLRRHLRELVARAAAERPAGRGEHERVDRLGLAALEALEDGGVLAVDGQQQRRRPRSRAASASSPAATRLSLLASASVTPCSSAQSVAWMPAKPTTAFSTRSGSARSSSSVRSPPVWSCVEAVRLGERVDGCEPDDERRRA